MDCFYDGKSSNWKLCFSSGCFAAGSNNATQAPCSSRLQEKKDVTVPDGASCASAGLPLLSELGGDAFLAALAATLNIYKDRIDNPACEDPDYLDDVVGWDLGSFGVRGFVPAPLLTLIGHTQAVLAC
jgi:hypothetical protein